MTTINKLIGILLLIPVLSCSQRVYPDTAGTNIVPATGYDWPAQERTYWPTDGWRSEPMEMHGIQPEKMKTADQFAANDPLARALLVVKDGYLVFEKYYGEGGVDQSSNLWSVTKSISSALVGMLMDQNRIDSTNQRMAQLMPAYPAFNNITLDQVLTQTTGLSWSESGQLWNDWIFSDDWVASALARGPNRKRGNKFFYSSGNSYFLTSLVYHITGMSPGKLAKDKLFGPLGIPFDTLARPIIYNSWCGYLLPLSQTWRRDPKGIETAGFG